MQLMIEDLWILEQSVACLKHWRTFFG